MKKTSYFALCAAFLISVPAFAQLDTTLNGYGDGEQLGMMAGLALACNAGAKLDDYELIAGRILANQSQSAAEEKKSARTFAEAKFDAYQKQKQAPQASCGEILDSFNHLPLFKSVVYADGVVKLPDGTFLKPRKGAVIEKAKPKAQVKAPVKKTQKPTKKAPANTQK